MADENSEQGMQIERSQDESGKLIYKVPTSTGFYFKELFADLDSQLYSLCIENYSVRSASLEEVFIKIGEDLGKFEKFDDDHERRLSKLDLETIYGERSCWKTFNTYLIFSMKTSLGKCCGGLICFPLLLLLGVITMYLQIIVNPETLIMNDY